jgi:L-alanine-DL-glutamate epimerase-like enolase superfamily enzyme
MEVTELNLYTVPDDGASETDDEETPESWVMDSLVASPMSIYPEYHDDRRDWWSYTEGGPVWVEVVADTGDRGFAPVMGGNYARDIIDTHYRQFVEGANPFDTERVWEQMYRAQLPYGQAGLPLMAISGVDLALWDLKGRITDQPVYNLLGGQTQDELPCYVTTHPDVMEHVADEGFLGVKLAAPWGPMDGYREGVRKTAAVTAEARELFPEDAEVMFDCFMAWDREFTVRAADRLAEHDVKWFEDPLHPGALHEYADVRDAVKPIQLAVGNFEYGHRPTARMIEAGAADIVQPEIRMVGGMTEMVRLAGLAKSHGVPLIPHVSGSYCYQFAAAHTVAPYVEYLVPGDGSELVPLVGGPVSGDPVPEDGAVTLGDDPGFGLELDRDAVVPV